MNGGAFEGPSPGALVLVVEDESDIWRSLEVVLRRSGHRPIWAPDGPEGLRLLRSEQPDLVILDISLPGMDGWEVLQRIRHEGDTPVMLLTARGLESEKVRGLKSGADDYLTKPFSNGELVARVAALLRRSAPAAARPAVYDDGRVVVDFADRSVRMDGGPVGLRPSEFRLLAALVQHEGHVLTPGQLLEQAWHDPTGTGPDRVKYTVLSLRRALGWTDLTDCPIETVRGFGYRYRRPPD